MHARGLRNARAGAPHGRCIAACDDQRADRRRPHDRFGHADRRSRVGACRRHRVDPRRVVPIAADRRRPNRDRPARIGRDRLRRLGWFCDFPHRRASSRHELQLSHRRRARRGAAVRRPPPHAADARSRDAGCVWFVRRHRPVDRTHLEGDRGRASRCARPSWRHALHRHDRPRRPARALPAVRAGRGVCLADREDAALLGVGRSRLRREQHRWKARGKVEQPPCVPREPPESKLRRRRRGHLHILPPG